MLLLEVMIVRYEATLNEFTHFQSPYPRLTLKKKSLNPWHSFLIHLLYQVVYLTPSFRDRLPSSSHNTHKYETYTRYFLARWLPLHRFKIPHNPLRPDNEGQRVAYAIGPPVSLIPGLLSKPDIMFRSLLDL